MRRVVLAIFCSLLFMEPAIAQQTKHVHTRNKKLPPVLVEPRPPYDIYKYLSDHLYYPEPAKEAGVQGRVIVQFWVDEQGAIADVRVVRGIGAGCDEEAKRIVNGMPKWQPGTYGGKPTKMRYTLPVKFRIE